MTDARTLAGSGEFLHYVSGAEVEQYLDRLDVIEVVRSAFRERGYVDLEHPPRLSLGDGGLLVMTARSPADLTSVVKVLHIDREAPTRANAAPAIAGIIIWLGRNDQPILVADAGPVTVMRTAAMVAIATDLLAEPQASTLAMLGSGRQAAEQISQVALVRPLSSITIWSRTRRNAEGLAQRVSREMPNVRVTVAGDGNDAVRHADIVCCATAATSPLFDAAVVRPGTHVNAVGSYMPNMCELPTPLLAGASIVAVDDIEGCLVESGEIIDAIRGGVLEECDLSELGALLADCPPRDGVTVFKSVGVALADFAVASLLQRELNDTKPAYASEVR